MFTSGILHYETKFYIFCSWAERIISQVIMPRVNGKKSTLSSTFVLITCVINYFLNDRRLHVEADTKN